MTDATLQFDRARAFVGDAQSVLFFARLGERVLRCYVTRKALVTCFGGAEDGADEAACLRTYDSHANAIQGVARRMIETAADAGAPAVVVTTSEVFRSIVQLRLGRVAPPQRRQQGACHG